MPAMRETWVQLLDREDPLEKETTTHSSVLAWRVPWTEEPGGLQVVGSQESDTTWHYSFLSPALAVITALPGASHHCPSSSSTLPFTAHGGHSTHSQGNGMTQKKAWAGEEQRAVEVKMPASEPEFHPN